MRVRVLVAIAGLLVSPAHAGDSPCGVALGTWGDSPARCSSIRKGSVGKHDQGAYMLFKQGRQWEQWEAYCGIEKVRLVNNICSYRLRCEEEGARSVNQVQFQILGPRTIAFAGLDGKYSVRYEFCTSKNLSPLE